MEDICIPVMGWSRPDHEATMSYLSRKHLSTDVMIGDVVSLYNNWGLSVEDKNDPVIV